MTSLKQQESDQKGCVQDHRAVKCCWLLVFGEEVEIEVQAMLGVEKEHFGAFSLLPSGLGQWAWLRACD